VLTQNSLFRNEPSVVDLQTLPKERSRAPFLIS